MIVTTLLCGCATTVPDARPEDAQLQALAAAVGETRKLEMLEPRAVELSRGRAMREAAALALKLTGGSILRVENGHGDCTLTAVDCLRYIFAADLPSRHAFLVFAARYEGGEWYLIDDHTAKRTRLDAPPMFSPDGAHFLAVANDEAYSSFFGLEIHSTGNDSAMLEWRHSLAGDAPELKGHEPSSCLGETLPSGAVWHDNAHIALQLKSPGSLGCPEHSWSATIELAPGGWRLITDWPRGG